MSVVQKRNLVCR